MAAICLVKTTFLGKEGRVPTDKLIAIMGYNGPNPAFPDSLAEKDALDAALKA